MKLLHQLPLYNELEKIINSIISGEDTYSFSEFMQIRDDIVRPIYDKYQFSLEDTWDSALKSQYNTFLTSSLKVALEKQSFAMFSTISLMNLTQPLEAELFHDYISYVIKNCKSIKRLNFWYFVDAFWYEIFSYTDICYLPELDRLLSFIDQRELEFGGDEESVVIKCFWILGGYDTDESNKVLRKYLDAKQYYIADLALEYLQKNGWEV